MEAFAYRLVEEISLEYPADTTVWKTCLYHSCIDGIAVTPPKLLTLSFEPLSGIMIPLAGEPPPGIAWRTRHS